MFYQIALNCESQAKRQDLQFFLKEICGAEYRHELLLAPTQGMLDRYKKEKGSWAEYESEFLALLRTPTIQPDRRHANSELPVRPASPTRATRQILRRADALCGFRRASAAERRVRWLLHWDKCNRE